MTMAIRQNRAPTADRHADLARVDRRAIEHLEPADLFDAWMFAEADATLAIATWRSAPTEEKGDAHAAYLAALDRETQAARVLALRLSFA